MGAVRPCGGPDLLVGSHVVVFRRRDGQDLLSLVAGQPPWWGISGYQLRGTVGPAVCWLLPIMEADLDDALAGAWGLSAPTVAPDVDVAPAAC